MIKAVIFDVDGTLLDSVDLHAQAWQEAMRHFGRNVPLARVRAQIGKGGDQLLPLFFSKQLLLKIEKDMSDFRAGLFKRKYLPRVRAFPDVRKLFLRIKAEGLRLALASSAKEDELKIYKKIARIDDLIEHETSSADAKRSKPHPDIFHAALAKLKGVTARHALVVGDSPWDAIAAGKAGMKTVGFLCGGFPKTKLRAAGCFALYEGPTDLLRRYDRSPFSTKNRIPISQ